MKISNSQILASHENYKITHKFYKMHENESVMDLNTFQGISSIIYVTRSGPLRPKSIFFKIELLTESVNTHFKKYFGPWSISCHI